MGAAINLSLLSEPNRRHFEAMMGEVFGEVLSSQNAKRTVKGRLEYHQPAGELRGSEFTPNRQVQVV